jgi:hypothetical protein
VNADLLDPRFDAEPDYWPSLRKQAGLRADWSWNVLAAQAWCVRNPMLVAVFKDTTGPRAVIAATWAGLPARRHAYVPRTRRTLLGLLDVRAPGTGSAPGWWADPELPLSELLRAYARTVRRELGPGCRALLLRQVDETELPRLTGRPRLVRPTEPVWLLPAAGLREWTAGLSRNRRKNLRRLFREVAADSTLTRQIQAGSEVDPERVAALLRHVERKYHRALGPLPVSVGYLAALLAEPDVRVISYRDGATGELLAAVTVLDHPTWPLTCHWAAVPATEGGRPNLYFDQYGAAVDWAARTGKRGVNIGRGKPALKASLGALRVPQYVAALPI